LPGNVTAWSETPIYARSSGYLQRWYSDIGARVRQGALLAEISSPDLDDQVTQAEADLATAQANANHARDQARRYKGLVASDAVTQEATDQFVTEQASTASSLRSSQANLERLKKLQGFEKVYAPFAGVITARNVDKGQLIAAGSNQLFYLQAISTLRIYTNVPETASASVRVGDKVPLVFAKDPGCRREGMIVRTSNAVDPTTRTLLVEVDVDNRDEAVLPGEFAQVYFVSRQPHPTYVVPSSAIIYRGNGLFVGTVETSGVAHLKAVSIGEDDGGSIEIASGINANDRIIQDPPDSLYEGEKVRVLTPAQGKQTKGASSDKKSAEAGAGHAEAGGPRKSGGN
jgi:RND family efflux transporter MFP subunit